MPINPDEISLEETDSKGRYVYTTPEGTAELTFSKVGADLIIIDHTGVPAAFRGQGVAAMLVERAVADARAAGKSIMPLCSYAAAQFRRHPDWVDVLDSR